MNQNMPLKNNLNVSDQIFEIVIERICKNHYRPGSKVGERKLAREFGISQIPIRGAFEKLLQQGWIEKIPRKGSFVRRFDTEEIKRLFELRQVIETGAISLVALKISDSQLLSLENIVERLKTSSQGGNVALYEEADLEFHRTIISFLQNPRLLEIYDTILNQSHGLFLSAAVKAAFSWGEQLENNPSRHDDILNALKKRDQEKAQHAISLHIKMGCDFAIMIANAQSSIRS